MRIRAHQRRVTSQLCRSPQSRSVSLGELPRKDNDDIQRAVVGVSPPSWGAARDTASYDFFNFHFQLRNELMSTKRCDNRTSQLLAELKTLANAARDNIYTRISIASQVLADTDWIATVHGGDEIKARDALQHEFFHELGGSYTLGTLIEIFKTFDEPTWKERRYNLQTMRALWEEQREVEGESVQRKRVKLAEYELAMKKVDESQQMISMLQEQLARANETVDDLREQNAVLRGRIEELERRSAA